MEFRSIILLQAALKIAFFYFCLILGCLFFCYKLPQNFLTDLYYGNYHNKRRVVIYTVSNRIGEKLLGNRMLSSAENLGWKGTLILIDENLASFWLFNHIYFVTEKLVNYLFKPEFSIAATHYIKLRPSCYSMVYLNMPNNYIFSVKGSFLEDYKYLKNFDAYLDLYSITNGNNKVLIQALENCGKVAEIFPAYFGCSKSHYNVNIKANSIALITGTNWGCSRGSLRVSLALKRLAKNNLLVAYGLRKLNFLGGAYLGTVEKSAEVSAEESLLKLHNKYGIALLLHNLEHMVEGLPTSRISEAIVAGAVVISDENIFIKKYFGDSVLYFDVFKNDSEIYEQINDKIEWIRSNPLEAAQKAKKAYEILDKNEFFLEQQLLILEKKLKNLNVIQG